MSDSLTPNFHFFLFLNGEWKITLSVWKEGIDLLLPFVELLTELLLFLLIEFILKAWRLYSDSLPASWLILFVYPFANSEIYWSMREGWCDVCIYPTWGTENLFFATGRVFIPLQDRRDRYDTRHRRLRSWFACLSSGEFLPRDFLWPLFCAWVDSENRVIYYELFLSSRLRVLESSQELKKWIGKAAFIYTW